VTTSTNEANDQDPRSALVEVPLGLVIRAAARSGDVDLTDYLFANYGAQLRQLEADAADQRTSKLGRLLDIERGPRPTATEANQVIAELVDRQISNVKQLARDLFSRNDKRD
jgi:hypothetical protein